ncbi:MAG: transcriptional regulator [Clostridia bacterium]|jgi:MarR family 2-MHQ and catechol resistance regulon transcriptional repressor|nr:transcriptional regulator [Clostridia bacterium]
MQQTDQAICNIFNLMPTLSEIFFKSFEKTITFAPLSKSHIKTLMFLRFEGTVSMTHISQKVELEKGSFTSVAQYLIDLGYVEKIKLPKDKRMTLLTLTSLGQAITERIMKEHHQHIEKQLDKLSPEEKNVFLSAVDLLLGLSTKLKG